MHCKAEQWSEVQGISVQWSIAQCNATQFNKGMSWWEMPSLHILTKVTATCNPLGAATWLSANCTLHTTHSTLYTTHYTLNTVHCTLYTTYYTLHTTHYTLYTVHCTLYTAHWTLYTAYCTLNTHCLLQTALWTRFQQQACCTCSVIWNRTVLTVCGCQMASLIWPLLVIWLFWTTGQIVLKDRRDTSLHLQEENTLKVPWHKIFFP